MRTLSKVSLVACLAIALGVRAHPSAILAAPQQAPTQPIASVQEAPPQNSLPAAAPAPIRRVRISGGVMASQRLSFVDPVYPEEARAQRAEGTVVLLVTVGMDGAVKDVVPVSGPLIFQQPAIDAVRQWTYKRYQVNGQPAEVETTVTVNFRR